MFWKSNIESPELSPTGSSFEINFDTLEEEYATSLRFLHSTKQTVMTLCFHPTSVFKYLENKIRVFRNFNMDFCI